MMKQTNVRKHTKWLLAALLVLALSVTLLASCDRTPGGTDTTADPSVSADTPTGTDPNGNPVTGDPTGNPEDSGTSSVDPIDTEDATTPQTPSETTGEPPVIEIPADETLPDSTVTEDETDPPIDPSLHPGDSSLYKGVLIHSVYGTGKKGAEALISNGYIQLYNKSNKDIALTGASLYYKSNNNNPFDQFVFPEGAIIPAGGYYLVRTNAPERSRIKCF